MLESFFEFIKLVGLVILRSSWVALTLDFSQYQQVHAEPRALIAGVIVLIVASWSQLIGQMVVLHINRTPFWVRVRAELLGLVQQFGDFVLWLAAIGVVAGVVFGSWQQPESVFRVLSVAYAPMMFSVIVLVPYAGPFLVQVLRLWTVMSVTVAISITFPLHPVAAAFCAVVGWAGHYLVVSTISRFTHTHKAVVPGAASLVRLRERALQEGRRDGAHD